MPSPLEDALVEIARERRRLSWRLLSILLLAVVGRHHAASALLSVGIAVEAVQVKARGRHTTVLHLAHRSQRSGRQCWDGGAAVTPWPYAQVGQRAKIQRRGIAAVGLRQQRGPLRRLFGQAEGGHRGAELLGELCEVTDRRRRILGRGVG